MTKFLIAICAGTAFAGVLLVSHPSAQAPTAPDPKLVAAGRKLFNDNKCTKCHMAEGVGNKNTPLDGISKKLSAADIRKWIVTPIEMTAKLDHKPPIPMKKIELKTSEVDALVAYVVSLK